MKAKFQKQKLSVFLAEDIDADGLLSLYFMKSITVLELDGLFSLCSRPLIPTFHSIFAWKRKRRSF